MTKYYSSTAQPTTLAVAVNSSATAIVVTAAVGFPTNFPYNLVIDGENLSQEIVKVTALSGTSATVVRGQDGTTAVAHLVGATIVHSHIADDFTNVWGHINNTSAHGATGNVVGTQNTQSLTNKTLLSADSSTVAAVVEGVGGQTANILEVRDSSSTILFSVQPDGASALDGDYSAHSGQFAPTTNGVVALTVNQKSGSGSDLVDVEDSSSNQVFGIDSAATTHAAAIFAQPITADTQVALKVKKLAASAANIMEVRDDANALLFKIDSSGQTWVTNDLNADQGYFTQTVDNKVPLITQSNATSTVALQSWRDHTGAQVARADSSGNICAVTTTADTSRTTAPFAKIVSTADQFIATGAGLTVVTFDTNAAATTDDDMVNTSANRLIAKYPGTYMITAQVTWDGGKEDTGRYACLMLNNTTRIAAEKKKGQESYAGSTGDQQNLACICRLDVNDYVQVQVDHNSGSGIHIANQYGSSDNSLSMGWIAP